MNWTGLLGQMTRTVRNTFGEPVSYWRRETGQWITTRPDGAPLTGIFDPEYVDLTASGGSVDVSARSIMLEVRNEDLGFEPVDMDRVQVQGKAYTIIRPKPSSSGMTQLQLRKS